MSLEYRVALDIGGSGARTGLVSGDEVVNFREDYFEGDLSQRDILDKIDVLVDAQFNHSDLNGFNVNGIGIACPGIIFDGIIIKSFNLSQLEYLSLSKHFSSKYIGKRCVVNNDGNCFAYGEYLNSVKSGVEKVKCFIGITLGTGVGGGIVYKGEL